MSQESRPLLSKEPQGSSGSSSTTKPVNEVPFAHTIGPYGSFALIMNNLTGPAMLGFPALFQTAGIIPVTLSVVFAWIASSLCGTLMADAISSVKGNKNFSRQIDFSAAFRLIVGKDWYVLAEVFFLLSCAVQACASLVEAAQSLDGFIASFLMGRTAALQIYPSISIILWDTSGCHEETEFIAESNLEDCTPFHEAGPLILSAGFLLVTMIFLPLGLGQLKETIAVQIFSMISLFVLLGQFFFEFIRRGLDYNVPLVGSELSQLAGVVLFNYAFSITVPSWLSEKDQTVSVNRTIWSASSTASVLYMIFGMMGAMSFEAAGSNILVSLASNKVHHLTRFCAALFGVTIIGCGVPVFCVIIKTGLQASGLCSPSWALFVGGILPFSLSWMLYQGTILMNILNWAGLIINGIVAFMLPMVLALKAIELRSRSPNSVTVTVDAQTTVISTYETAPFIPTSKDNVKETMMEGGLEMLPLTNRLSLPSNYKNDLYISGSDRSFKTEDSTSSMKLQMSEDRSTGKKRLENLMTNSGLQPEESVPTTSSFDSQLDSRNGTVRRLKANAVVQPLPEPLEVYRREVIIFMIASFAVIILTTIAEDAITGILVPVK